MRVASLLIICSISALGQLPQPGSSGGGGGGGASSNVTVCAATGGSANAQACPGSPVPTTLTNLTGTFIPNFANTGAVTLNIAGLGAKAVSLNGVATSASVVLVSGQPYQFYYDGSLIQASGGAISSTRTWSYLYQGTVQAAATGYAFNLPAATSPTMTNGGGTVPIGVLEWPVSQTAYYAWVSFLLPTGYVTNAAISFSLEYRSSDSTHASILTPAIACQGTSSTLDNPTFGNAPTSNLTAGASSHQTITAGTWTPNSGSIPACSAGQRVWVKLTIDTNTNSLTGPFDLASATFSVQGGQ